MGSLPMYLDICPPPRDIAALQHPYGRVTSPTFHIPRLHDTKDYKQPQTP